MKILEKQIQQAVIEYLRYQKWYTMRLNSGAMGRTDNKGKKFFVRMQEAGTPDIIAFKEVYPDGAPNKAETTLIFIEVKVPGKEPTILQLAKMKELAKYGARCLVIHSVEELIKLL